MNSRKITITDSLFLFSVLAFFVEGAVRKWLLVENSLWMQPVALSKFAFLGCALIRSERTVFTPQLDRFRRSLYTPFTLIVIGSLLSSNVSISYRGAAQTLLTLIVAPFLATWIPRNLSRETIGMCAYATCIMIIVLVPLVIYQFFSPQDHLVNAYVAGSKMVVATTGFSQNVRATGSFSYITGLSIGALVGQAAGMYLTTISRSPRGRWVGLLAIFAALICGFSTVSRGTILAQTVVFGIWLVVARKRLINLLVPIVILGALFFIVDFDKESLLKVVTAVGSRNAIADDSYFGRFSAIFLDASDQIVRNPLGGGLGLTQNVSGGFSVAEVETELGRIVFEIGVTGFLGFLLLYWGAVAWLLHKYWSMQNMENRTIVLGAALGCGVLVFGGVVFNHISCAAFWGVFCLGAFFIDYAFAPKEQDIRPNFNLAYDWDGRVF